MHVDCVPDASRPDGADGGTGDSELVDASYSCETAEDCPSSLPPCHARTPFSCGCGEFKFCASHSCSFVYIDCDVGPRDSGPNLDATMPHDAATMPSDAATMPHDAATHPDASGSWDIGPTPSCTVPADCQGSAPSVQLCPTSAHSCVANECIWDCAGPRTCTISRPSCISCNGGAPVCESAGTCFPAGTAVARVEESTCPVYPGTTRPFSNRPLEVMRGGGCDYTLAFSDTRTVIGTYYQLSDGNYLGFLGDLGDVCTGVQAPTGVARILWSCPYCQFVQAFF